MMWLNVLAAYNRVRRFLTPEAWFIVGAFALFLVFLATAYSRGVGAEKDRQAVEAAKVERRASTGRETAAVERLNDRTTSQTRLDQRNADAQATPDSTPSPRDFRRGCRQLREAGIRVPECSGFDSTE